MSGFGSRDRRARFPWGVDTGGSMRWYGGDPAKQRPLIDTKIILPGEAGYRAGGQLKGGFARYIEIDNTILSSPVSHGASVARTTTGAIPGLPTDGSVVLVQAGCLLRVDVGTISTSSWSNARFGNYADTEAGYNVRAYQTALDQWNVAGGLFIPGGANGNEIDYEFTLGGATTVVVYYYIAGYFTVA
jgi:hypothetical protein